MLAEATEPSPTGAHGAVFRVGRRRLSNMIAERGYRNGMLYEEAKQRRCWHRLTFTEAGRERAGPGSRTLDIGE